MRSSLCFDWTRSLSLSWSVIQLNRRWGTAAANIHLLRSRYEIAEEQMLNEAVRLGKP